MIFEPRVEDEGTYKCEAANELGKVSYEVSLYVEMSEFFCCIVIERLIVIDALHVFILLKGKYHANLLSFQNPKMFVCQQKQRNNCQVCYKLSPQCNKTVD